MIGHQAQDKTFFNHRTNPIFSGNQCVGISGEVTQRFSDKV